MPNFKGQPRMASSVWFPFYDLRNMPIINAVKYQFCTNIFFCIRLILFVFNLAVISLTLLFGATHNYSNFSSWATEVLW